MTALYQVSITPRHRVASLVRDPGRATIRSMPRPLRKVVETPELRALDATTREYNQVEARLYELRDKLLADAIAAIRAGLSIAEAARRTGYSREHLSRLYSEANARDGRTKPDASAAEKA